jgi:hypothetical protein
MRKLLAALWLTTPILMSGCANNELGTPQPFRSGPVAQQRARAQHFDPYPTDAGGGDILGGRPEDYHDQIPEPARSRWTLPKFLSRRPVPPPMAVPAPPQQSIQMPGPAAPMYPSTGYPPAAVSSPGNPPAGYAPQAYRPAGS